MALVLYFVIECKHWLISCEIGCCAKRQSIIASYDNYDTFDVLTHGFGNMQTQTVAASICKVYHLLGGGQTACLTQTYFKILH